jgi:hypothetical protein
VTQEKREKVETLLELITISVKDFPLSRLCCKSHENLFFHYMGGGGRNRSRCLKLNVSELFGFGHCVGYFRAADAVIPC